MAFHEARLVDCVAMGYSGGPRFSTTLVSVRSGYESRNRNWQSTRHTYDIGLVARPLPQFEAIKAAFMVCGGRADGFRFKDAFDYTISIAESSAQPLHGDIQVGTGGAGYGVPSYQLRKRYAFASAYHYRDITKPVTGTLTLTRGGSPVTAGVAAGNYALSTTTGRITFVADQTKAITAHTPGGDHVLTAATAFSPNFSVGDRVFITGVTGTAADLLNNLSHQITVVASDVITIATDTTGLTASGGFAYFYPQSDEALAFACQFDVPVRFDLDEFQPRAIDREGGGGDLLVDLPSIPLVEIRT